MLPAVLAGQTPSLVLFRLLPGIEISLRADPFGLLFALGASLLWVSRFVLLHRVHANSRGARADALLHLLRPRALGDDGRRVLREPLHSLSLLRRPDPRDLSSRRAQGDGRGQGRRPQVRHLPSGRGEGHAHPRHHSHVQPRGHSRSSGRVGNLPESVVASSPGSSMWSSLSSCSVSRRTQ